MDSTERQPLLGTTLDEFAAWCAGQKLPGYRAKQVFEWLYAKGATRFEEMTNLSKPLRSQLDTNWSIYHGQELRRQVASDGTTKLLIGWPDGASSECVLIPEGQRRTVCLSSQVGCPVKCAFCASGAGGLQRQLATAEMIEQVKRLAVVSGDERLSNVVFMGTGEPLANYDAVLKAVRTLNADWGMNIGARKITISTVGIPKMIRRLANENLQINLALSLHAPNDQLRQQLIPWAARTSVDELTDAVREYFDVTGREVTVEYLLLGGVNDRLEHAYELVTLCRRMRCNLNLIRYNPVEGLPFERPSSFAAHQFSEALKSRGVNAHIRKSKGIDIDAACGQLRRRELGRDLPSGVSAEMPPG